MPYTVDFMQSVADLLFFFPPGDGRILSPLVRNKQVYVAANLPDPVALEFKESTGAFAAFGDSSGYTTAKSRPRQESHTLGSNISGNLEDLFAVIDIGLNTCKLYVLCVLLKSYERSFFPSHVGKNYMYICIFFKNLYSCFLLGVSFVLCYVYWPELLWLKLI